MIRRLASLLLTLTLFTGCGKDPVPEREWIRVQPELLLAGAQGSRTTFVVTALGEWSLTATGEGFTASSPGGSRGETLVTVTATEDNPGKYRRTLGRITLHYAANGTERTVEVLQGPVTAPQTVLLYMPGRTLNTFYKRNIEGIRKAVSARVPGDGRMLVCWQPESLYEAELYEISYDYATQESRTVLLKSYPRFSADNTASVAGMLADIETFAPAARYGLIIGCHGKAWIPASEGAMSSYSLRPDRTDEEAGWPAPAPGALVTRSFGDARNELDIDQLSQAFRSLNYRFDYLLFDACFMASIETIYDLREAVDYYIASPCEIMGAGFPYDRTLPYLFAQDGAAYDLQRVCEEFYRFYNDDWQSIEGNARSGCISLAVLSEIAPLAEVVRRINESGLQAFDPAALQYYEGMGTHLFYDLGHYVALACDDTALRTDFAAQLDKAFPPACRLATPAFYSVYNPYKAPGPGTGMHPVKHYSGVNTSELSSKYADAHKQTAWYLATHAGL